MRPLLFPDDQQFWFEALRSLGHTAYGGADIGEVVSTAEAITAGDYDGWHDQWLATADRVAIGADRAAMAGHRVSAREGTCAPRTTTAPPSSSCTDDPTIRASRTPTTAASPASAPRPDWPRRQSSRSRSPTREPRCPGTSTTALAAVPANGAPPS
ncbi:hypothetical protein [Dactylosporangium darangshiense]|uniref:hypothetical protein n=1 Tax=Dactylosporangium darangshiense TaxID=579108 RepID=UPI00363D3717